MRQAQGVWFQNEPMHEYLARGCISITIQHLSRNVILGEVRKIEQWWNQNPTSSLCRLIKLYDRMSLYN
jgi:hypothetical protein